MVDLSEPRQCQGRCEKPLPTSHFLNLRQCERLKLTSICLSDRIYASACNLVGQAVYQNFDITTQEVRQPMLERLKNMVTKWTCAVTAEGGEPWEKDHCKSLI